MTSALPRSSTRGPAAGDWTDAQRMLVKRAHDIAVRAHSGQKDKAGHAYIGHASRVAAYLATSQGTTMVPPEVVAAGWLHDVVEDTELTLDDLMGMGLPEDVVGIVEAVTTREGETALAYASRIAANPAAVLVKRADLRDNSDSRRMAQLDAETRARLRAKYRQFMALLDQAVQAREAA